MSVSSYFDAISIATHHALESDWDMPQELLPLIIVSEASMLAGFDSDTLGHSAWG